MGPQLVVTTQEWEAMQAARSLSLVPEPMREPFLLVKIPNGCPHLGRDMGGKAFCRIYEARPVNCRRFMCLRPDVTTEPWEDGGPQGCRNLSDRLESSLHALTFYQANERRAMKDWGLAHGWHKRLT